MSWKYILFDGHSETKIPVIFPEVLVHADVAAAINDRLDLVPSSAGSVEGLSVVITAGGSETLSLESRPEDATIINTCPYTQGILIPALAVGAEKMVLRKTMEMLKERLKLLEKFEL